MPFTRTDLGALDLNLLHALVVLVEERSTTTAAKRLGLAQSTVSGTLKKLRHAVGDELLVRHGRELEATPRALELAEACRPHLDGLIAAIGALSPFDPATDTHIFRLGCTDAVALTTLPKLTNILRRDAPNCDLVIRIGDYRMLPGLLAAGEITTALAYMRDDPSATSKMRAVLRSPWVVLRDPTQPVIKSLDDFVNRPHALVTPAGDLTGFVDESLAAQNMTRRVVLGVTSFALLLPALKGTDLVSTVPDFIGHALADLGGLACDPCPVQIPAITNSMSWRAAVDQDPAERWFRSQLDLAFTQPEAARAL
ncbi:LysR family transcriptional regulator [Labrenzia sp. PHM005]|uniref:LysR family transcriptional regulator n=1 Tax=Labrenzia sp. PHM005 TaxID=2590016 RepID=UPI001140345D|nr:LysR family transcriptional regulator [Labrenzia sp. PHM005]QDG77342.1 LysR family transcriptional regulator [Labrenzia sp. PHM005]